MAFIFKLEDEEGHPPTRLRSVPPIRHPLWPSRTCRNVRPAYALQYIEGAAPSSVALGLTGQASPPQLPTRE